MFKKIVKKLLPKSVLNLRHLWYAYQGARKYSFPSNEIMVIGVTGTSGKSSTIFYLRQLLERCGHTVGSLSTIDFSIAGEDKLNDQKMTMLGKMQIQKYVREMVDKKCDIAIIETTSEGRVQHRHRFINYDMMVLTNLYPEHIASHGSFENYMQAKIDLFSYTAKQKKKTLAGKKVEKIALVDNDHEEVDLVGKFTNFTFDRVFEFSGYKEGTCTNTSKWSVDDVFYLSEVKDVQDEEEFLLTTELRGDHTQLNKSIAASIAVILGHEPKEVAEQLEFVGNPPGRIEYIQEAKQYGFDVIVDYAFEPVALTALYKTISNKAYNKIIHVTGNTGGGRDKPDAKAACIAEHADVVVVTNEDPYDDDPIEIINYMADVIATHGKVDGEKLFRVEDRQVGIEKALELAEKGDIVLVTGKGSEQAMCLAGGKKIPWDDREAVRTGLKRLYD